MFANDFYFVSYRYVRRMRLGTGDIFTLEGGEWFILYGRITLDINKQRVYWIKYDERAEQSSIFSSDYDGKDQKSIVTDKKLNRNILRASDNSIFIIKSDEARILIMNDTGKPLSRSFMIENSEYYDLIIFNNNFNHTTGK